MSTLYELTEKYKLLLEMADEADPQTFADTLEALDGEVEEKADGYAKVMKTLEGDVNTIKAEIERLKARKDAIENNIKRMKDALQQSMLETGKTKFKTDLFSFAIANNPPAVVMDEQYLENIPEEYLIEMEPKLDRAKLKADLQAGVDLEGIAHLEQGQSLRIR